MPNLVETQVNTYATSSQHDHQIATLSTGGWVVTWNSEGQDGDLAGIFSQAFNADGTPLGNETQVNTYTTSRQEKAQVAGLDDGGWVITWVSVGQNGETSAIYAQTFNADGSQRGGETLVNTSLGGIPYYPEITALSDDGWVVTWQASLDTGGTLGIFAQAFNANGTTRGVEAHVNTYETSTQQEPKIAGLTDGGWVIIWESNGQDGDNYGVYLQAYNADGTKQGSETQVNTYTTSTQYDPTVTSLSDGGWVVTWVSYLQDGGFQGVYQQAYNSDGSAQGSETLVNTYTNNGQDTQQVAALIDGGWVVTWTSIGQDGDNYGIYSQAYNANGTTRGVETQVNTFTALLQYGSQITALTDGGWVITWMSFGQDGDESGIYYQAYHADGSANGVETRVNTETEEGQIEPKITALDGGGWVIAWQSLQQDGDGHGLFQQAYYANGATIDGSFIATDAVGAQQLYSGSGIVTQSGSVTSATGAAIGAVGLIDLAVNGDVIAIDGAGVDMSGSDLLLTVGATGGIISTSDSAVAVNSLGAADIKNAGSISGSEHGVYFDAIGQTALVLNTGTIEGSETGIFSEQATSGTLTIKNSGTIIGGEQAIVGSKDDGSGLSGDVIYNSGLIMGDVEMRSGDDLFDGRGGLVSGAVYGGDGEDSLFGSSNDDALFGGDNQDVLRGRKGEDDLNGGKGADTLRGQDGDDTIEGNQDNDLIFGGRGDDEIKAGSGADTIKGGGGDDLMTGGSGADVFIFKLASGFDEITDFNNNTDKLDLSAFNVASRADVFDAGAIVANGAGSMIDLRALGGDGVIYVEDMSVAQWSNADFIF
ncbi:hypothetical protein [Planktotalea sp.]|uniref:calcium-binding protein n=1 Tax=Planktotalea sp. TaxID=2029877 RepID=UPI003D6C184C